MLLKPAAVMDRSGAGGVAMLKRTAPSPTKVVKPFVVAGKVMPSPFSKMTNLREEVVTGAGNWMVSMATHPAT